MAIDRVVTVYPPSAGAAGGVAIRLQHALTVLNNGVVAGGGGGGAGGPSSASDGGDGGSGGAGARIGRGAVGGYFSDETVYSTGAMGDDGSSTSGGSAVGNGYAGGDLAQQGLPTSGGIQGGAPGAAIKTNGHVLSLSGNTPIGAVI